MIYAIIRLKGHQYKVSEGQEILVDFTSGSKFEPETLLIVDEGKIKIGKPTVDKAKIEIKVLDQEVKGNKIHVYKFRAKSRYRKHVGFRPKYTRLLIEGIKL